MSGTWVIVDYGNPDYVNILDEHGGKVVWGIYREHAERIMAGLALLVAAEAEEEAAEL
jgi:hypothetical protein